MLNVINTLPIEKMKKLCSMNFLSEMNDRKERKKRKKKFQNKCALVPKTTVIRKEEGATAVASHLPSPWRNSAGWFRKGRTGRVSPRRFILQERPIKYHKCPTFETPAFSVSTD